MFFQIYFFTKKKHKNSNLTSQRRPVCLKFEYKNMNLVIVSLKQDALLSLLWHAYLKHANNHECKKRLFSLALHAYTTDSFRFV